MMRHLLVAACLLFTGRAQDVPPPTKPQDGGPTSQFTMKYVENKLNGQRKINSLTSVRFKPEGQSYEFFTTWHEVSEAVAAPSSCTREENLTPSSITLYLKEEDTAHRMAKAPAHTVELCGGSHKDPFK